MGRRVVVLLCGQAGVGKTNLCYRWSMNWFLEKREQPCEQQHIRDLEVHGEHCQVELVDTPGNVAMQELYTQISRGFVLVYSITCRKSFEQIVDIKKQIEEAKRSEPAAFVLAANKSDLGDERQVTEAEGRELADKLGTPFFEVNAANGADVNEMIEELVRLIPKSEQDYHRHERQAAAPSESRNTCRIM